ncbi:MAG: hypothetical protein M2R45_04699 [Verrucomicrobia subdivision 3 bacterium]|nr:hypothetical protein [Limisphaerales bacterium]MCS1416278.1 hypothetical protein [Limisphaerales bacterium]
MECLDLASASAQFLTEEKFVDYCRETTLSMVRSADLRGIAKKGRNSSMEAQQSKHDLPVA